MDKRNEKIFKRAIEIIDGLKKEVGKEDDEIESLIKVSLILLEEAYTKYPKLFWRQAHQHSVFRLGEHGEQKKYD